MGVDINYCRRAYPLKNNLSKNIAVDIGANIGGFSMAYHNVFNKILYFEANPETYKITKENLKNYPNIEGYNLGVSYVSGKKMHVAIDLISPSLKKKGKRKLSVFVNLTIALFSFVCLVIGGVRLVYITSILGQNSPALQIPLAIVYLIIPISGLLIIYYKMSDILIKK